MNDLAADETYKSIVKKMFAKLLELQPKVGDNLDLKSVFGEL